MEITYDEFEANCLNLIDGVAATREPLVITKRGKPIARLVPIEEEPASDKFGYMSGTVTITGDIVDLSHDAQSAKPGD